MQAFRDKNGLYLMLFKESYLSKLMFFSPQQTHFCAGKGNLEAKPAEWPVKEAHHQVWLARNSFDCKAGSAKYVYN